MSYRPDPAHNPLAPASTRVRVWVDSPANRLKAVDWINDTIGEGYTMHKGFGVQYAMLRKGELVMLLNNGGYAPLETGDEEVTILLTKHK